jgi:hypothetical protein
MPSRPALRPFLSVSNLGLDPPVRLWVRYCATSSSATVLVNAPPAVRIAAGR